VAHSSSRAQCLEPHSRTILGRDSASEFVGSSGCVERVLFLAFFCWVACEDCCILSKLLRSIWAILVRLRFHREHTCMSITCSEQVVDTGHAIVCTFP
jgi:hypothetical protein